MQLELLTDRFLLRPLEMEDLDIVVKMFTDPDVVRYLFDVLTTQEIEDDLVTNIKRGGGGCIGVWCIVDRISGEKMGTGALLPLPIDEDDTNWELLEGSELPDADIEVGYILKRDAWGKGIATEVCRRLLQFAFEETPLDEIVACISEENKASRNVLNKCEFEYLGFQKAYAELCPVFRMKRETWL